MKCLFVSLAFFLPFTLSAQPGYVPPRFEDAARMQKIRAALPAVEKIYADYFAARGFPGAAFGLVVDSQLVLARGFGYSDLARKVPATPATVFRIASMTKSFTALAILKLRDEGKLKLDDPASLHIPQLKGLNYLTSDAAPITVRQLMTHAAGFPEDNPWGDRQLADTDAELLQLVEGGVSFSTLPGQTYEYSNLGFALLGQVVARASGRSCQDYIGEELLQPLGMNHTYWEYTKVPANLLARGYRSQNGKWTDEPLLHDGAYGPMGGLLSSVEDFARYIAFHLSAWPARSGAESPVLSRGSLREMHHPWNFAGLNPASRFPDGRTCATTSAYGYGLRWTKDCAGRVWSGHSGGLPGFGSNWTIFPDYGIGLVCFANGTYAPTSALNLRVLDTLISLAGLKPRAIAPSPILLQRQKELVQLLPYWKGAEDSGIFAENFFPDNPPEALRKQSAALFNGIGKVVRVHEIEPENQLRGTFVVEGEQGKVAVFFTLTPEREPKIQELRMRSLQ